jgi:hypothetical protein
VTGPRVTDIGNRAIPSDARFSSDLPAQLAVQPQYQTPDFNATEFLWTGFGTILNSGLFVVLTDPTTNVAFSQSIDKGQQGRIAGISICVPDMVAAVAPYLTVRVAVNAQPAPAWGNIVLEPVNGVTRKSYDTNLLLQPGAMVQLQVANTDLALSHYVQVQLYGWSWSAT